MKTRGFEIAKGYEDKGITLPIRKTKHSAGYDIAAAEDVIIPTGLKAYCALDEFFILVNRSSGPKKGFVMSCGIGIADADYYNNETNDGHFFFQYYNFSNQNIHVKKGDIIGQVIFQKYLLVDDDVAEGVRKGGFGSTNKNN